jgi:hypothetical protein
MLDEVVHAKDVIADRKLAYVGLELRRHALTADVEVGLCGMPWSST